MAKMNDLLKGLFYPREEEEDDTPRYDDEDESFRMPLSENESEEETPEEEPLPPERPVTRVAHSFKTVEPAPSPPQDADVSPLDDEARALFELARAVREKAWAVHSGFPVGAALRAKSGQVYMGVNVENASYPCGICAERAAICSAITAGEREFLAIAVCGGDENKPCMPCGLCRQTLAEFCGEDFKIITANGIYRLGNLMPYTFKR